MNIQKITTGFVTQTFDSEGKLLEQNFTAGDECDWENEDGEPIEDEGFYHPFDMVENDEVERKIKFGKNLAQHIIDDSFAKSDYEEHIENGLDPEDSIYYQAHVIIGAEDEVLQDIEEYQEQQRRDEKNGISPRILRG
jgi:hypothetical protein